MRRWILPTVLLFAFLLTASPATADPKPVPPPPIDCSNPGPNFGQHLDCWKQLPADSHLQVTIAGPIQLDEKSGDLLVLKDAKLKADNGALKVSVPDDTETSQGGTGQGGTVLLILASPKKRLVAPNSTITRLDQRSVKQLTDAGLCDALCKLVAGTKDAKGKNLTAPKGHALVKAKLASGLNDGGGGGLLGDSLTWLLIAVLAAGLLVIAFLVVRRSPTPRPASGPSTSPAPRPPVNHAQPTRTPRPARHAVHQAAPAGGPRVTAVLRTDLHPQGYVELDNCLFRAAWCDAEVPPPALGEPVEVVKGTGRDADLLLAYPPGNGR